MSGTTAPKVVQGAAEAAWSAHAPRLAGAPAAELQRVTTARIARAGCRVLRAGGRGFLRLRRRWVRAALAPRARSITSGGLLLLGSIMIPLTFHQAEGCPTRARSTRAHNGRQEEEEAGPPAGGGGALCRRGVAAPGREPAACSCDARPRTWQRRRRDAPRGKAAAVYVCALRVCMCVEGAPGARACAARGAGRMLDLEDTPLRLSSGAVGTRVGRARARAAEGALRRVGPLVVVALEHLGVWKGGSTRRVPGQGREPRTPG